ncbi:MAG TPA: undecaprenyldiphospho-muramoylpentapeptide beta-N-acetylglucosaminyltransferase [Anaerolineaceae bacterium]|nr:undecaprenyldiphospho-muramoylpentapeptide beta-N-acetylglucosaminyltransferase [Anaerolineaceae bacterium]
MKLLICAGMTGGGVYPALAVLQTLTKEVDEILWVGSEGGMENEIITRLGIPFKAIPAAGLHGVGLQKLPGNLSKLARGYQEARTIIHTFRPDVFFSTGGYLSVPVAMAARHIPSVVFIPDIEPALALKVLIRYADRVLTSTAETEQFVPQKGKITLCGYPLRREITRWKKSHARKELALNNELPVLLVFGGSKGAQSINRALYPLLSEFLEVAQVVHISGLDNYEETREKSSALSDTLKKRYHLFPYLHENMGAALAAADLVVCRAGASTLGELPFFNLPAILVPYPHAWRYQKTNADHLAHAGAAIILQDEELSRSLKSTVLDLLCDPQRLQNMQQAMRALSTPDAAEKIGKIIVEVGTKKNREEQ